MIDSFFAGTYSVGAIIFMLLIVNGAPILAARSMGSRFARPIDAGRLGSDGRRLLGQAKTWRGVVASLFMAAVIGVMIGWALLVSIGFSISAMIGDCLASWLKRRKGLQPSEQAVGLDHIPEAFFPVLFLLMLGLVSVTALLMIPIVFFLLAISLSRVLYILHLRKRPY